MILFVCLFVLGFAGKGFSFCDRHMLAFSKLVARSSRMTTQGLPHIPRAAFSVPFSDSGSSKKQDKDQEQESKSKNADSQDPQTGSWAQFVAGVKKSVEQDKEAMEALNSATASARSWSESLSKVCDSIFLRASRDHLTLFRCFFSVQIGTLIPSLFNGKIKSHTCREKIWGVRPCEVHATATALCSLFCFFWDAAMRFFFLFFFCCCRHVHSVLTL